MIKLGFHHFETLVWIARLGSFSAAAERMNTTQPGISARVREIEAQLQTRIFRREGRGVVLTPRGRKLVAECEPLLVGFNRVLLETKGHSSAAGVVRFAVGEIAAASCLPDLVEELGQVYPGVALEVELDLTSRMLHNLLTGTCDIAFLAGPVAAPGLLSAAIGSIKLVWVAAPSAIASGDPALLPLWSVSRNSPIFYIMDRWLALHRKARTAVNNCNNLHTIISILKRGQGVALLPETMVRAHIEAGELVEVFAPPTEYIEFQSCIRAAEQDPLILSIFERTRRLRIGA